VVGAGLGALCAVIGKCCRPVPYRRRREGSAATLDRGRHHRHTGRFLIMGLPWAITVPVVQRSGLVPGPFGDNCDLRAVPSSPPISDRSRNSAGAKPKQKKIIALVGKVAPNVGSPRRRLAGAAVRDEPAASVLSCLRSWAIVAAMLLFGFHPARPAHAEPGRRGLTLAECGTTFLAQPRS